MELKQKTTHVVIVFMAPRSKNQPKQVDLVPRSWLTFLEGQWFSQYPPPADYPKVDKWVKTSKPANLEWSSEPVRIVKEADSYYEGLRRLERSYSNSNVESTSAADEDPAIEKNEEAQPKILSNTEKDIELQQAPSIDEADNSSEVIESEDSEMPITQKHQMNIRNNKPTRQSQTPSCRTPKSQASSSQTPTAQAPNSQTSKFLIQRSVFHQSQTPRSHTRGPRVISNVRVFPASDSSEADENDQSEWNCPSQKKSTITKSKAPKPNSTPVTHTDSSDEFTSSPRARKRKLQSEGATPPSTSLGLPKKTFKSRDVSPAWEQRLKNIEQRILSKIDSAKRSVLYDIEKKTQELKNTLTLSSGTLGLNVSEQRKALNIELPVRDLDTFLQFDAALVNSPEREKALKCLMAMATHSGSSVKEATTGILKCILAKPVQQAYSAFGRQMKGERKRNFSITNTCSCMLDVIMEKCDTSREKILSIASRWLSGCGDREGGRAARKELP